MNTIRKLITLFSIAMVFTSVAGDYEPPRTFSGKPDLQGYWTNASLTKMERDPNYEQFGLVFPADRVPELTRNHPQVVRQLNDDNQVQGQIPDGSDLAAGRGYNSFWVDPGSQFAVVKGEVRTSMVTIPDSGVIPYSDSGRKLRRENRAKYSGVLSDEVSMGTEGPEARALGERCIIGMGSTGGPPINNVRYNNMYQIIQTDGYIVLMVEMAHDVRIIPIDSDHRPDALKPWLGDSIAHWEGDTLVVETINLHPQQAERGYVAALSEQGKVIERFSRYSKGKILYEFEVTDPVYYEQTWGGEMSFNASATKVYEYACHEGNYGMSGILGGARRLE
tara:strand:- start:517 stop:1521 length:1005 start_codon:yes stop_codon:yes gene_type:complete